jgi:hypothetical protein
MVVPQRRSRPIRGTSARARTPVETICLIDETVRGLYAAPAAFDDLPKTAGDEPLPHGARRVAQG